MTGRYPIILNGDHAEFEAKHADTPPHERPDWPLPSFDARDWADAFCKINPGGPAEDVMIGWFANALMRGFDEARARAGLPDAAHLEWAVSQWNAEVANRPLQNIHRRSLDTTWRQMIRRFGGDPDALVGPSHDALSASPRSSQKEEG